MTTDSTQPTTEQWTRLYELAAALKQLAPWEWMDETQMFGVEHPVTKESGFISPMGMLGEHLSLGVYLGAAGLHGFRAFQAAGGETDPLALLEIPQLQVSFENREQLAKQDRELFKQLGLKFRGKQNYPLFRSIRPGFMPWFITAMEAELLTFAIEQTLEVAPRVKANPRLLSAGQDLPDDALLVRVAENRDGVLLWRDEMQTVPPPDAKPTLSISQDAVDKLKSFPQAQGFTLEIDLFYAPTPVGEKGKRPYFPKMLLLADARNGMILGFQLIQPEADETRNHDETGQHIFAELHKLNVRPQEIHVISPALFALFKAFNQQLNIRVRQTDELPAVEAAREELFGFFGGASF